MIKPKYQIGEKVWVIGSRKVIEVYIEAIEAIHPRGSGGDFVFSYRTVTGEFGSGEFEAHYQEADIFPTKEDLITNLSL